MSEFNEQHLQLTPSDVAYELALDRIYSVADKDDWSVLDKVLLQVEVAAEFTVDDYFMDSDANEKEYLTTLLGYDMIGRLRLDQELVDEDVVTLYLHAYTGKRWVEYVDASGRAYAMHCPYMPDTLSAVGDDPAVKERYTSIKADSVAIEPDITELAVFNQSKKQSEVIEESTGLTFLDQFESDDILLPVEIHGQKYTDRYGRMRNLTKEELWNMGLEPRYKTTIEGVEYCFSDVYELYPGRNALVGYVDVGEGNRVARTFYQSKSQALWRYLPSHSDQSWYDKGHKEDSLNLPILAQVALAEISSFGAKKVAEPGLAFFGTTKELSSPVLSRKPITYYIEVERKPDQLKGNFFYGRSYDVVPPEQLNFTDGAQVPDFAAQLAEWQQDSDLYGNITMRAYASQNGDYKYIFCTDRQNRSWVGAVENNAQITSTGVRESWVNGGDLLMPLYEYASQACGYGGRSEGGHYVEMWQNYLSKTPVIRQFHEAIGT